MDKIKVATHEKKNTTYATSIAWKKTEYIYPHQHVQYG
jgi:hypothetical protein